MANLGQTKLFSVAMGEDALCDCGQAAETQFVIATGVKEAKNQASQAKKARVAGERVSDVCCGVCVAQRIAQRGFFVTEVMKHSPIKWERVTDDLKCEDCGAPIPFGVQAHFHAASNRAICGPCGVRRGWSDSKVALDRVVAFELKETLAALRRMVAARQLELSVAEGKISLHKIGESYLELGGQIEAAVGRLNSFLEAVATPGERVLLEEFKGEIIRLQTFALSVKEEYDTRLFFLEKNQVKVNLACGAASTPEGREVPVR